MITMSIQRVAKKYVERIDMCVLSREDVLMGHHDHRLKSFDTG